MVDTDSLVYPIDTRTSKTIPYIHIEAGATNRPYLKLVEAVHHRVCVYFRASIGYYCVGRMKCHQRLVRLDVNGYTGCRCPLVR